jgi:Mg2+/Co2+ transporter CorB
MSLLRHCGVLVLHAGRAWGWGAATGLAFATFLLLVLFGEILPKSFVYLNARPLAVAAAVPVFFIVQVFGPIALFFRILFLEPVLRLFFGRAPQGRAMTLEDFRSLVDLSVGAVCSRP